VDVSVIHNELRQGITKNLYIFTGPEWAVQQIYIDQISKVSGKQTRRVDKLTNIKSNKSSFVPVSYVYICRDDKEFMSEEKLQNRFDSIVGNNIFILLVTSVDKRTKFYKAYKDTIIEFEALKPAILKKYIQKETPLLDDNVDKLMEICEYDYGRCLLEIDKIKTYGKARMQNDPNVLFHVLLQEGIIYQPPYDAIFDFVDAILDRKPKLSWKLYRQCLDVGEAIMVMVSVLYNNTKAVLQVQACESKDVSKTTGLTGWQINNARKHCGVYRNGELIHIMELCQDCEQGIKTGKMPEAIAMEYIMVNVF